MERRRGFRPGDGVEVDQSEDSNDCKARGQTIWPMKSSLRERTNCFRYELRKATSTGTWGARRPNNIHSNAELLSEPQARPETDVPDTFR